MTDVLSTYEEKPVPWWQRLVVLVLAIGLVLLMVLDWSRFVSDFWPFDRSFVGPNLVASVVQYAALGVIAILVWPPLRRAVHHFVDFKLHTHLDHHRQVEHEHHATERERVQKATHDRLDAQDKELAEIRTALARVETSLSPRRRKRSEGEATT